MIIPIFIMLLWIIGGLLYVASTMKKAPRKRSYANRSKSLRGRS